MFDFNNYSIKQKLLIVFIFFKAIPLIILAVLSIYSFLEIDALLKESYKDMIQQSKSSVKKTTDIAISESIVALDIKSQSVLENKTKNIANNVARFLYQRDSDILLLSSLDIDKNTLQNFYNLKRSKVYIPSEYFYDKLKNKWVSKTKQPAQKEQAFETHAMFKNFHKVKKQEAVQKSIPLYKEISFYKPDGKEIYKVSALDKKLKDISNKNNSYLRAEDYFLEAKKLKKGEIYVSRVIGEYIPSPVIGSFTKEKAKLAGIKFEPEKYAYAGKENPLGKKFSGIIRFVTPVYKGSKLQGFLTLALDHQHVMNFTDFHDSLSLNTLDISDASNGNYAFMWDNQFTSISHPRDYFIVGYDSKTGEQVPGWTTLEMEKRFIQSKEKDFGKFLKTQSTFFEQSSDKKPSISQAKKGQVALDCKYLNFAPQCQGWVEILKNGGFGSFVVSWSNISKLNTVAPIPYYTGQYKNSEVGFGFVTIGTNVNEFHKAAINTRKNIDKVLEVEYANIQKSIEDTSSKIYNNIQRHIILITSLTILLIALVVYIAIYISYSISKRLSKIITGTQKLKEKDFDYQLECNNNDELGELCRSFNTMAASIKDLTQNLENKLYTDDLTKLSSRPALYRDIKSNEFNCLLIFDIDSFKSINDHYGAHAGNYILVEFATILQKFGLKHKLHPYRVGSDEFVLLTHNYLTNEQIKSIVSKLDQTISSSFFKCDKCSMDTTISFTCGASSNLSSPIECADLALNEAKLKKLTLMIYDDTNPNMNKHSEFILWKQKIIYAIENNNIIPYFQPIIDVKNPESKKYECLIRMIDNENIISPYMFLDISKEARLYPQLTRIMIEKSFEYFHNSDATFSINISIDDIQNKETLEFMDEQLLKYDVGDRLILEILESEEIDNFDVIFPFIKKMKAKGVRFAVDDFGSGYSNFSYLLKMKPDLLKIDGSLIKNISKGSDEYYVVDAIVKFASALDIELVAEFVSTKNILDTLKEFDIDFMQGYYFSEPRADAN